MFSMRNQATYTGLTVVSSPPHSPACLHSPALPIRLGCCFKVCPSSNLDFYYKSKSFNFILIKSVLQYLINQASTDFVVLGNLSEVTSTLPFSHMPLGRTCLLCVQAWGKASWLLAAVTACQERGDVHSRGLGQSPCQEAHPQFLLTLAVCSLTD